MKADHQEKIDGLICLPTGQPSQATAVGGCTSSLHKCVGLSDTDIHNRFAEEEPTLLSSTAIPLRTASLQASLATRPIASRPVAYTLRAWSSVARLPGFAEQSLGVHLHQQVPVATVAARSMDFQVLWLLRQQARAG